MSRSYSLKKQVQLDFGPGLFKDLARSLELGVCHNGILQFQAWEPSFDTFHLVIDRIERGRTDDEWKLRGMVIGGKMLPLPDVQFRAVWDIEKCRGRLSLYERKAP